jgi:hypothetical protein
MISVCRRGVVAAGDYVRFRSLRFAPTHIHRPYSRRYRVGCKVDAAGDYVRLRSLLFAPTHIHRPYSRRYRVGCKVVDAKHIYSLLT